MIGWPAGALQVLHPTGFTARHEWAGVTLRRAPHQRVADLILVKGETFRLQYTIVDKRPPAMMPAATLGEDPQSIRVPYTVTVKVHFAGGDVLDFEPIEHSAPGEYFLFLRDPLKVRNVLAGRLCQPETVSVWKEGGLASECRWSACGSEAQNCLVHATTRSSCFATSAQSLKEMLYYCFMFLLIVDCLVGGMQPTTAATMS